MPVSNWYQTRPSSGYAVSWGPIIQCRSMVLHTDNELMPQHVKKWYYCTRAGYSSILLLRLSLYEFPKSVLCPQKAHNRALSLAVRKDPRTIIHTLHVSANVDTLAVSYSKNLTKYCSRIVHNIGSPCIKDTFEPVLVMRDSPKT